LLSLLFVPALFIIMDDVGRLSWRIFGRFLGAADEPVQAGGTKVLSEHAH
jgi:hypothetical protein